MSLLGGCLLGQKNYTEAERLLLAGHKGMKEREAELGIAEEGEVSGTRKALGKAAQFNEWR